MSKPEQQIIMCPAHSGVDAKLEHIERRVTKLEEGFAVLSGMRNVTLGAFLVLVLNGIMMYYLLQGLGALERMVIR